MSKSRVARMAVVALLAALIPIVAPQSSFAATACGAPAHKNWVGDDGALWSEVTNWDPPGVPSAADEVCVTDSSVTVDVVAAAATLDASAPVSVVPGASLTLSGTGESVVDDLSLEGTLVVAGPFAVTGDLQLASGAIVGTGTLRVDDDASILVTGETATIGVVVVNNGSVEVKSTELRIDQVFTNEGSFAVNGMVPPDGSSPQRVVASGAGTIVNSGVLRTGDHSVVIDGPVANPVGGRLEVGAGGLTAGGLVSTQGVVNVAGSVLAVSSFSVSSGGSLELSNTSSVLSVGGGDGQLTIEAGGSMKGAGIVNGSIDNAGELDVLLGASAGKLTVVKNYVGRTDSLLVLPLQGSEAGPEHAQLTVNQTFTAAGTVEIPTDDFVPTAGEQFRLVQAGSSSGEFSAVNSGLAGAVILSSTLDATGLLVTATNNTGSISGTVYDDSNGNGQRNTDEPGIAGRTVYVDVNGNHVPDQSEASTTTDADGNYVLEGIVSGAVSIETALPADWMVTSASATAEVSPGGTVVSKDFGEFQKSDITGTAFIDTDGNGIKSAAEDAASGRTVYLDVNKNGVRNAEEPSATTDGSGAYRFTDVSAGQHRARIVLTNGYVLSTSQPAITARSGMDSSLDFGLYLFSSVRGTVFRDLDRNGVRNSGEPALAGRGIFVDKNRNGVFDGVDVSSTTATNGSYTFSGLIGTQQIRLVLVPGEFQTPETPVTMRSTSGATSSGVNIGVATPVVEVLPEVIERSDPMSAGTGYWFVASDGGLFSYGDVTFHGSMGGSRLNSPIVGFDPVPNGDGYHMVAGDGGVFSFGGARFQGSMGGKSLNSPMVGIASTPTGNGYWTVAGDGGVFSYGDAPFHGSMGGQKLNSPIVDLIPTATGAGYWQVAADGGVFSYGDAPFLGSAEPHHGDHVVVGMARSGAGGYWIADADGGVYSFGEAQFHGSMGGQKLNSPIVGIRSTEDGAGYWLFAQDGGVFSFGSAKFYGGTPRLNAPIVE